jgi:hypothetical protein
MPLAYALQLTRIARRSLGRGKWTRAALILFAKIPDTIGAARFLFAAGSRSVPEYKARG